MWRYFAGWFVPVTVYAASGVLLAMELGSSWLYPEAVMAYGLGFMLMSVAYVCRVYGMEQDFQTMMECIGCVRFRCSGALEYGRRVKRRYVGAEVGEDGVVFTSGSMPVSSADYADGTCVRKDSVQFVLEDGQTAVFYPEGAAGLSAFQQVFSECGVEVRRPDN